jgi:hypothetical protein
VSAADGDNKDFVGARAPEDGGRKTAAAERCGDPGSLMAFLFLLAGLVVVLTGFNWRVSSEMSFLFLIQHLPVFSFEVLLATSFALFIDYPSFRS